MITLTCGVPGAGKTLWTVATVEARRVAESRPVYYSGIADLSYEWIELADGESWESVPDGAIVVVDEAQRLFPVRKQGSPVPPSVRAMETHRHRGIDLYFVSQNHLQLDSAVRHLVGEYRFLERPFGQNYSVVWRFGHVCDWKNTSEQAKADKTRWKFPKQTFGAYKSAEVHTHKRSLPRMVYLLIPLLAVIAGGSWWAYSRLAKHGEPVVAKAVEVKPVEAMPEGIAPQAQTPAQVADSKLAYLQARTVRVRELPESAPVFDALAVPVTFPRVAACYFAKDKACQCYTQQGTPTPTLTAFCVEFVKHGAFDPYQAAGAGGAVGDDGRPPGTVRSGLSGKTKRSGAVIPAAVGGVAPSPAKPVSAVAVASAGK